jgi:hypothetical protein
LAPEGRAYAPKRGGRSRKGGFCERDQLAASFGDYRSSPFDGVVVLHVFLRAHGWVPLISKRANRDRVGLTVDNHKAQQNVSGFLREVIQIKVAQLPSRFDWPDRAGQKCSSNCKIVSRDREHRQMSPALKPHGQMRACRSRRVKAALAPSPLRGGVGVGVRAMSGVFSPLKRGADTPTRSPLHARGRGFAVAPRLMSESRQQMAANGPILSA